MDPSGIFPTSYRADNRVIRTRWQALALALFVVFMLAAPYLVSPRIIAILNLIQNRPHLAKYLPEKLKNWDYLPKWMRSLEPIDE